MSCVHHWMVDTLVTDGGYLAECKMCKKTNKFSTVFGEPFRFPSSSVRKSVGIEENTRRAGWLAKVLPNSKRTVKSPDVV